LSSATPSDPFARSFDAASADAMRRVQAGDETALGGLMDRWELPVKSLLARMVFNTRDAVELAQETFVRVWTQRAKFRAGAEFRPWLFAIAVNLARNRLRWWKRRPEVALEEWSGGAAGAETGGIDGAGLEQAERAAAVQAAVASLPPELREAIVLFEYEQLSHGEIALTVGATPKAIESRIYRAKEKLRAKLGAVLGRG
jgi:RNA polymerase sigma-70 factor (ECF subfamily)